MERADAVPDQGAAQGAAVLDASPAYFAFISYSHRDERSASWLHKALETYRVPKRLVGRSTAAGTTPPRLLPIFRDRDELASATDLGSKVNAALARSKNLIVICSPAAAASRWVNEEVLAFKRLGGERIFCLIVDGEPNASDLPGHEVEECFAPALRFELGADGQPGRKRTEPIAADARYGKDGKSNARLKLIAGLLDVGFDVLKQRELQRRNRRMAAVTALALVVMAITTTLAITAVNARHDAERRLKQSEALVDFMLGDLNHKLSEINRLDILESVDDKAMAYFKSLPASDVSDEALVQRAKALERIGSVRLDQGHLPAALDSYEASLKLISAQARAKPQSVPLHVAWAEVVLYEGMAHWFQADLEAAERSFRSAGDILERVGGFAANDADYLVKLQDVESNLGHVLESRGRLGEAREAYEKALHLAQTLVALKPDNVEWQVHLGGDHNNLGKIALQGGDLVAAVTEYAADDRIESDLSASHPQNKNQRQNMFRVRAILGRTLALAGETDAAIRALREAVEIAGELNEQAPTIATIQENLALYRMQLSRLLRVTGHVPEAIELTGRAFDAFAALVARDPTNKSWQREFAETRAERAAQLIAAGKRGDAQIQLHAALGWLDPALEKQPDDRATLLATLGARLQLAVIVDDPGARTLRETCLETAMSVKSGIDDPRLLALKASTLLGLGRKSEAQGVIDRLRDSGYRDPAFVRELQDAGIEYAPNPGFQQRMKAVVSDH